MIEILKKYFKDNSVLYFTPIDAMRDFVEGESYIRFEWLAGRVVLWVQHGIFDEGLVKMCSTPEELEQAIKILIY